MTHHAKKSLGQHFLVDDNVIRKILHAFSPRQDELIVEIGPGQGALTRYLDELRVETLAIELDETLVEELRKQFRGETFVEIRHQDILQTDFAFVAKSTEKKVRVLGNLPYNISSPLLFHLLESRKFIADIFVMVQKEIAERITADPDSKDYGILSVLIQTYAEARYAFTVSRNVFRPKPRVSSAMVSLNWHDQWSRHIPDEDLYRVVVRTAFGKRRKILRNALQYLPLEGFDPDDLEFDIGRRAEQLEIRDFIKLTREISEKYPDFKTEIEHAEI